MFRPVSCEGGIACRLSLEPRSVTECKGACDPYLLPNSRGTSLADRNQPGHHLVEDEQHEITEMKKILNDSTTSEDIDKMLEQEENVTKLDSEGDAETNLINSRNMKDVKNSSVNGESINFLDTMHVNSENVEDSIINLSDRTSSGNFSNKSHDNVEKVSFTQSTITDDVNLASGITTAVNDTLKSNGSKVITATKTTNDSSVIRSEIENENKTAKTSNTSAASSDAVSQNSSFDILEDPGIQNNLKKDQDFDEIQTQEIDTGIVLEYDFMVPANHKSDTLGVGSPSDVPSTPKGDVIKYQAKVNSMINSTTERNASYVDSHEIIVPNTSDANKDTKNDASPTATSPNLTSSIPTHKILDINPTRMAVPKDTSITNPEYDYNRNGIEYDYDPIEVDEVDDDNEYDEHESSTTAMPRPSGIIEDKLNIEDFEIIEMISTPERENKKHKKKHGKVKGKKYNRNNRNNKRTMIIHEGEEAISLLNEIIGETVDKQEGVRDFTSTKIGPQYRWSAQKWSNVSKHYLTRINY